MTNFGRFLWNLRIGRKELLLDMANKLNVQVSILSGVEHAKIPMPEDWPERITEIYELSGQSKLQMMDAIRKDGRI